MGEGLRSQDGGEMDVHLQAPRSIWVDAPCLAGETGGVSSFSEEQFLASLFGQPTQGHEEV